MKSVPAETRAWRVAFDLAFEAKLANRRKVRRCCFGTSPLFDVCRLASQGYPGLSDHFWIWTSV